MTILHCYTSTHNDLYMIQFYVRHWSRYASKLFVYDDDSTDGTREFLESCAPLVEVRSPGFHGIDELLLQDLRSNEYRKHSRGVADWVTIGDSDELHYHPDMLNALEQKRAAGFCAVVAHGYQMFSDKPPEQGTQMTDAVKYGIPDRAYSRAIFDPALDIQWGIGHHGFAIENGPALRFTSRSPVFDSGTGTNYKVECFDHEFKMLHYKYLGEEYVINRHASGWSRLSQRNKAQRWGHHSSPDWRGSYSVDWYRRTYPDRAKIID